MRPGVDASPICLPENNASWSTQLPRSGRSNRYSSNATPPALRAALIQAVATCRSPANGCFLFFGGIVPSSNRSKTFFQVVSSAGAAPAVRRLWSEIPPSGSSAPWQRTQWASINGLTWREYATARSAGCSAGHGWTTASPIASGTRCIRNRNQRGDMQNDFAFLWRMGGSLTAKNQLLQPLQRGLSECELAAGREGFIGRERLGKDVEG